MRQEIRIIGGLYRGKKLSFPDDESLRPTPDRVRETLFNWLMHNIRDAVCLDAFAGSGALGFEAFSRGAKHVTFIEYSTQIQAHLARHINAFKSEKLTLIHADVDSFLKKIPNASFDIIFFDPPFKQSSFYEKTLKQDIARVLRPDGLLYVESPEQITLDDTLWEQLKLKQAGQVIYALYQKRKGP
jgi:16S rRNA (guanine966-N2)-methyltransferase